MSDLGLLLRKAREQRGYTLEDIQEATKIRKRYLEAIEEGDYKVLPGSFYVRAFVKTYAETVGLDAEEVLRLYHKELPKPPAPTETAPENVVKPKSRSVQHNDRWGKIAVTLVMWLFPILIIAVVYVYVVHNMPSKAKESDRDTPITTDTASPSAPPTSSASASGTMTSPPSTPTPPPTPSAQPPVFVSKSGSTSIYEFTGTHVLKIVPSGNVWVGVNVKDRHGKYLYNGSPKDELTFTLDGPIYVNLGLAKNAAVYVDDTLIEDGDGSGSQKFQFNPAATGGTNGQAQE